MSSGRSPTCSDLSAARAVLLPERTAENVATASTSVPAAVASDAIVSQFGVTSESLTRSGPRVLAASGVAGAAACGKRAADLAQMTTGAGSA